MPPLRSLYCPQSKHSHASPSADPQKSVSCPAGAAASIHHIYRHRLQGTSEKNTYTKAEERALSAPACSLLTTSVYLQTIVLKIKKFSLIF